MSPSEIATIIVQNSNELELSPDGNYYINKKTGAKYIRATQVIQAYFEGHTFDPNSPWIKPSTNIGTGIDELVRDFMSGRIVYNKDSQEWEVEGESLDKFTDKAFKAADSVAKTGSEMIDAATEFAKSGYDEDQALQLGQIALMYTNIADEELSAGDAASFIIAQMKAFNIEAEDSLHIVDALNEV